MKKRILWGAAVIAVILVIYFVFFYVKPNGSFEDVLNVNLDKVDKVDVFSGNTGVKKVITDEAEVKEFVAMFKDVELKKYSDQKQKDGFIFDVFFYKGNKKVASFNFGYNIMMVYKKNRSIRYESNKNFDEKEIDRITNKYNLNAK